MNVYFTCRKGVFFKKPEQGFSLVELLVALFVFSLLTLFSYRSVVVLSSSSNVTNIDTTYLAELQKGFSYIESDIKQFFSKLPVATSGQTQLQSNSSIEFLSLSNKFGQHVSEPVQYIVEDGFLTRNILNDQSSTVQSIRLLSSIVDAKFEWEYAQFEFGAVATEDENPLGLNISFEHAVLGNINRTIYLNVSKPEGLAGLADKLDPQVSQAGGGVAVEGTRDPTVTAIW